MHDAMKLLAAAALVAAAGANAQTPPAGTVQFSTGASCPIAKMETNPNGGVYVTCAGGGGGEAMFSIDAPLGIKRNTYSLDVKVSRTSGIVGKTYTLGYSVTGAGCNAADNPAKQLPMYSNTHTWSVPLVTNGNAGASCTVMITAPSGTTASPASRIIQVLQ